MNILRKQFTCEVKEVGERTLEFVGSTEAIDRDGEVILAKGWDLANYKKNPVFMWAHNYTQPPIGRAVSVKKEDGALRFQVEFAPRETYEFADTIYQLYKGGFLKATSVGFVPQEWEDGDGKEAPRRTYKKQELLELSAVPVPSNPEALIGARDAGILTTKDFEAIMAVEEKPYEAEHACRLRSPDDFQDDSFRRTQREHDGKKYSVIMGRLKGETTMTEQAYRYPKDTWAAGQARTHCKGHDGTFEAASEEAVTAPHRERDLSQAQIRDEFDYAKALIVEGNLGEDSLKAAWDIVRELLMRYPGGDIPVDILESFEVEEQTIDSTEAKGQTHDDGWDHTEVSQLVVEELLRR